MASQGEETVYRQRLEVGKFCLFNGGLAQVNRLKNGTRKMPLDAAKSLRNDRFALSFVIRAAFETLDPESVSNVVGRSLMHLGET